MCVRAFVSEVCVVPPSPQPRCHAGAVSPGPHSLVGRHYSRHSCVSPSERVNVKSRNDARVRLCPQDSVKTGRASSVGPLLPLRRRVVWACPVALWAAVTAATRRQGHPLAAATAALSSCPPPHPPSLAWLPSPLVREELGYLCFCMRAGGRARQPFKFVNARLSGNVALNFVLNLLSDLPSSPLPLYLCRSCY